MTQAGDIIVLDVGKTLSKISRWSPAGQLRDKRSRPNARVESAGIAVLDAGGIADWLRETLTAFATDGAMAAIIPVAHGAAVAAIRDGALAFAPLDYEQPLPDDVHAAYRAARDGFDQTGSPALPLGLNAGAQLHWRAADLAGATLLPWAQYWSWFLSGVATTEVTSLGCHTDLWNPVAGDFSALATRRGWAAQFAPRARAGDVIGTLRPEFGVPGTVDVHCGIHDSNAALVAARGFPDLAGREATVLSTGTWFVAMRSYGRTMPAPADQAKLPEDRDCLINVDAEGRPVRSARFMGGREIERLGHPIEGPGVDGLGALLDSGAMVLPGFAPDSGPFPKAQGRWINRPAAPDTCRAAVALYAALMSDTSLTLIGARDHLLIEGRFARSEMFVRALATLRRDMAVYTSLAEADVSFGAVRLVDPSIMPTQRLEQVTPLAHDLGHYKTRWHHLISEGNAA